MRFLRGGILLEPIAGLLDAQDEVEAKQPGPQGAHDFAQFAADAIAVDGTNGHFAANDESGAAGMPGCGGRDDLQIAAVVATPLAKNRLEGALTGQPIHPARGPARSCMR